jgi:potassium efflux system protein
MKRGDLRSRLAKSLPVVGVAPQAVIELLEKTAREHAAVLVTPAPKTLFVGYGDSSINFELRAWTDQSANWAVIRSELAVAVYDAVYAAGMAFPFPQRGVRVLGNATAAKTAGPSPDGSVVTMQKEKQII